MYYLTKSEAAVRGSIVDRIVLYPTSSGLGGDVKMGLYD